MSRRALVFGVLCAAAAGGCGDRRTPPPDLNRTADPVSFTRASFPHAGLLIQGPTNWALTTGHQPQVATLHDGQAIIAIWRYPRIEPLPVSATQLRHVIPPLLRTVRSRDPSFALLSARPTRLDRHPAVEIKGFETITGQSREVRSVHVYYHHAELVLDSFAPPRDFARVDRLVFRRVLLSVRLRPASRRAAPRG